MDQYNCIRILGKGTYGTAYLIEDKKTKERFVMKKMSIFEMDSSERAQAKLEVMLLSSLDHPSIVKYNDSFIQDGNLYIIMQYCEGGDLSAHIKHAAKRNRYFSEEQILDWFIQLTMAVEYIHSKKILHRDLKSSNIFLTRNNMAKLGDFGIARVLDCTNQQVQTVIGTPYYMSPEVCENRPYSYKSDLWALGCILYEMCTLKHAFDATNLLGLVFKIVQESQPPIPDQYSDELKTLVSNLLSKNPDLRPDAAEIMRMPFIQARLQGLSKSGGTVGQIISGIRLDPKRRKEVMKQERIKRREEELKKAHEQVQAQRVAAKRRQQEMWRSSVDITGTPSSRDPQPSPASYPGRRSEPSPRAVLAAESNVPATAGSALQYARARRDSGGFGRDSRESPVPEKQVLMESRVLSDTHLGITQFEDSTTYRSGAGGFTGVVPSAGSRGEGAASLGLMDRSFPSSRGSHAADDRPIRSSGKYNIPGHEEFGTPAGIPPKPKPSPQRQVRSLGSEGGKEEAPSIENRKSSLSSGGEDYSDDEYYSDDFESEDESETTQYKPESKARDARDAGKLVELFKDRLGPGSSSASGGSGAASGSSSTSQSGVASRIGTSHASTADATMGAADRPVMGQKERMEMLLSTKERLIDKLGRFTFDSVFALFHDLHTGKIKMDSRQVKTEIAKLTGGSRTKEKLAMEVESLLYFQEYFKL